MRVLRRAEEGQSLVEFALVLPIFALFLMGIIDFGRIVSTHLIISQAARDAVRYASLGDTDAQVQQVLTDDLAVLGTSPWSWNIQPSGTGRSSGSPVTVTVSDSVTLFDPLLGALLGNPWAVQSTVTMRME